MAVIIVQPKMVLHLVDWLGGGIERVVLDTIVGASPEFSHQVLYRHYSGTEIDQLSRYAVVGRGLHGSILKQAIDFRRFTRDSKPAVIHAHSATMMPVLAPLLFSAPRRPRVLFTEQGEMQYLRASTAYQALLKWAIPRCSVVAPTGIMANKLEVYLGVDKSRIVVVHNGVNIPDRGRAGLSKGLYRQRWGISENTTLLSFVGHLEEIKGLIPLIMATRLVVSQEFVLLIVGDGSLREQLSQLISSLGLDNRVRMIGRVPHEVAMDIMSSSDALILPSLSEGMGMVLIEAMSLGLPVVASSVGGVPEAVKHMQTGLLVQPNDPNELAKAIDLVVADPELRRRLGEASYQRAVEQFSLASMQASYLSLYQELARM